MINPVSIFPKFTPIKDAEKIALIDIFAQLW